MPRSLMNHRSMREADVARLDISVAEDVVPAFTRIVAKLVPMKRGRLQ
jgi:translation elongation factor EF-4